MSRSGFIFTILTSFSLVSCLGDMDKKEDPGVIYFDYIVQGEEESSRIVCKLQYWQGGKATGTAIGLDSPAGVVMDGEPVRKDSVAFNGIYYEVIYESEGFAGPHIIEWVDPQEKKYKTTFDFPVFSLREELPSVMGRDSLVINLAGLKAEKKIRIILTDTSFYGRGVERVDWVKNGRIVISREELGELANGPVHLEILWEEDKRLQGGPDRPGRIYTSYRIQRELLLDDRAEN
jgi:hypothetical protein